MNLETILNQRPEAAAAVYGSSKYGSICGNVKFYPIWNGTLVYAQICGLPMDGERECQGSFFGFHIHEGSRCAGNDENPFADAGAHLNPGKCEHPYHMGDLPPLLGNRGFALTVFYTERFLPEEIIGRTVIIHAHADDFKTQPSGAAGEMIACGEIKEVGQM